jgi:hypothetical protein
MHFEVRSRTAMHVEESTDGKYSLGDIRHPERGQSNRPCQGLDGTWLPDGFDDVIGESELVVTSEKKKELEV